MLYICNMLHTDFSYLYKIELVMYSVAKVHTMPTTTNKDGKT